MANLWERMTHLFGHKFTSVYGESAIIDGTLTDVAQTWASGLRGLTGDQLADGLRACVDCGEAWPPSLPEFVGMCKKQSKNGFGLNHTPEMYHQKNRPIRDKSKLLSNDEREEKRLLTKKIINEAAKILREKKEQISQVKKLRKTDPDELDYCLMLDLCKFRSDIPNIIKRINTFKPGSFKDE